MCLLAFAIDSHPGFPFVFVGNRDEFHARPARAAHWWEDAGDVFGGRDLEAGGAWLGVRKDGRFAVLTNFRDPDVRRSNAPSRGELVRQFLAGPMQLDEMHAWLRAEASAFSGFNIIYGWLQPERPELWYFSNAAEGEFPRPVAPGIHGLSNHLLDTPWPKVQRSTRRLDEVLQSGEIDHAATLALLDDTEAAADSDLPDTGIPAEWERLLSAPRIVSPEYGTRASSSILLDSQGVVHFHERSFDASGAVSGDSSSRFELA